MATTWRRWIWALPVIINFSLLLIFLDHLTRHPSSEVHPKHQVGEQQRQQPRTPPPEPRSNSWQPPEVPEALPSSQPVPTRSQEPAAALEAPPDVQAVPEDEVGDLALSEVLRPPPPLPPHVDVANGAALARAVVAGQPTVRGIIALLQRFLHLLNAEFKDAAAKREDKDAIYRRYRALVDHELLPFDRRYRGRPVFPIREDDSIFLSLASFRDHMLGQTIKAAFANAANPDKLFIGAVVQNCWTGCRTGAQIVGTLPNGRPKTKVSDAPADVNGIAEVCASGDPDLEKHCREGRVRVLYVNETESLGPAVARYHASKLWAGETFFVQSDSHLQFADRWDEHFVREVKLAKSFPKAVLSSYPPGFGGNWAGTPSPRLCTCVFSTSPIESSIIRINVGSRAQDNTRPTQVCFIAAGFFFARAEFLVDVPFDPLLPWCFMGEEIALSIRAWTHGWDIYAPRHNWIAHHYRPGRLGLPKFWGSVGRVFGRPGFNTPLQLKAVQRIKSLVGYPEATPAMLEAANESEVLLDVEHYSTGTQRPPEEFHRETGLDFKTKQCHTPRWCNQGSRP